MKKLFGLVLLLIAASTLTGQVYTEVKTGEYAISTYDLGQTDEVEKAPRRYWTHTGSGSLIADTVFYVASGEAIPNISGVAVNKRPAILFERGGEWDTTITVPRNNVIYASYGSGAKPKIYGSQPITGWTLHSGNIYKAAIDTAINQLFDDGVRVTNARFTDIQETHYNRTPVDTGYTWISAVNDSMTQLTLAGNTIYTENYFQGAKVIIRVADAWDTQDAEVISSSDSVINISYTNSGHPIWKSTTPYVTGNRVVYSSQLWEARTNNTNVTPVAGATWLFISNVEVIVPNKGMVIIGKLAFIDQAGEWAKEGDTVYYWAANSTAPTGIRGSAFEAGIYLNGKSNITVKNLHFLEQKTYGIYQDNVANVSGITIDNNIIENQELYGFLINPSSLAQNIKITNNLVQNNNASGIYGYYTVGSTITGNTVNNTGLFENWGERGKTRGGGGTAINIQNGGANQTGLKNTITWNRVSKAGYNGIHAEGWFSAQYNRIDSTTLSINDGGAIYTTSVATGGITDISHNIVSNSKGTNAGIGAATLLGKGVYLDEKSKNVVLENNTSVDNSYGITLHQPFGHKVRYNTTFNNTVEMSAAGSYPYVYTSSDSSKVFQNIYVRGLQTQVLYQTGVSYRLTPLYLKQDSNRYINPYSGKTVFQNDSIKIPAATPPNTGMLPYTFAQWKPLRKLDRVYSSINDALFNEAVNDQRVVWNETKQSQTWYTNNAQNVRDIDSNSVASTFVLEPFESKYIKGRHLFLVKNEVSSQDTSLTPRTAGTTEILASTSAGASIRRGIQVTFPSVGDSVTISSISVYHNVGSGNVLLGVYSDNGSTPAKPSTLLGATPSTAVTTTVGWQTINLTTPVTVAAGQKVWLTWIFQNTPTNTKFTSTTGFPGVSSDYTWANGLTSTFGALTYNNTLNFSVYCTYTVE